MLDGLNYLSNSVLEVSDTITPISTMNASSTLLEENIKKILEKFHLDINKSLENKKNKI